MNKQMGRPRDPKSIDSLGRVVIAVDRPTRDILVMIAKRKSITLVALLRKLAIENSGEYSI